MRKALFIILSAIVLLAIALIVGGGEILSGEVVEESEEPVTALTVEKVFTQDVADKYGTITIQDIASKSVLQNAKLIRNTDNCLINCSNRMGINMYSRGRLLDKTEYRYSEDSNVYYDLKAKYYLVTYETIKIDVPIYEKVCSETSTKNGTAITCVDNQIKTEYREETREVLKPYNNEEVDAGYYILETQASKRPSESIDVVSTFSGIKATEWAWWSSDWTMKKNITLDGGSASLTNFVVYLNVTYDADMQTDFDDLRFTNGAEDSELYYEIDYKTDGSSAGVWVLIPTLNAGIKNTTIYMYYKNPAVTSGANPILLWANTGAKHVYHFGEGSGTSAIDSATANNITLSGGTAYVSNVNTSFGYGLYFDGSDDKGISVNAIDSSLNGNVIRNINFYGTYQRLTGAPNSPFMVTLAGASGDYYSIGSDSNSDRWYIENGGFISNSPYPKNTARNFHNLNYDTTNTNWTINLTSIGSQATTDTLTSAKIILGVNKDSGSPTMFTLDELRILNRTTTYVEQARQYQNTNLSSFIFGAEVSSLSYCNFEGYVKDKSNNALNGANIVVLKQTNLATNNGTTNSSGYWNVTVLNDSIFRTVVAYYNSSLISQAKSYINATC